MERSINYKNFKLSCDFGIGLILLFCCYGCVLNSNKSTRDSSGNGAIANKKDHVTNGSDSSERSVVSEPTNISCDSLLILLIKTSSIDKNLLLLTSNERIDSIRNSIVSITLYYENSETGNQNIGYLQLDLKKKELEVLDLNSDRFIKLQSDPKLLAHILKRNCYDTWVRNYGEH